MKFGVSTNDVRREVQRARQQLQRDRQKAALIATDRGSRNAQANIRTKMKSAGLGRLERAVGQTSALKLKQRDRTPYGVIFAKGGDESRAGGALESYSRGATIGPIKGRWLWFQTKALQRKFGRYRATPGRYIAAGQPFGPLQFAVISPDYAIAYVENVGVSVKTGRVKALPKRRSSATVHRERVVLFEGIRITRRAQRFDKDRIVAREAARMPEYLAQAMAEFERDY